MPEEVPVRAGRRVGADRGEPADEPAVWPLPMQGRRPAEDRAPRPTVGERRHNLPAQPMALIGREQDADAARQCLRRDDVRLLTVTGPPGVGKTRLAVEVATDSVGELEDGAFFVDLAATRDPRLVPSAIAQTLGVGETGGRPLLESLTRVLRDRQLLLVLDNFEQVLPAAARVAELLAACPRLNIIVTSRAALHLRWEHELPLLPLAVPDMGRLPDLETLAGCPAVALFVARAGAVRRNFALSDRNARAVAEICTRLDGLPLAIELAAARVKLLPPETILGRLVGSPALRGRDDRTPLQTLTGGAEDLPMRQQTLRGAIAWSYDLLLPAEQRLFRQLAYFAGGCTLEAAEAVCGPRVSGDGSWGMGVGEAAAPPPTPIPPPPTPTEDLLASLIDKSLLRQEAPREDEPRLRMLDTIRELGLELLAASGEAETTQRRHAHFYAALAEQAEPELLGPRQVAWLDRLEREAENLRAALEWSAGRGARPGRQSGARHGEAQMGLRLAGALWRFWWMRGDATEARERLEGLLSQASGTSPTAARAKALNGAGTLARHLGDYPAALAHFEDSLAVARSVGDRRRIADALHSLGRLAYVRGDYAAAGLLCEEGLEVYRAAGDTLGIAGALHSLGFVAHLRGKYAVARSRYEESLAFAGAVGDRRGMAHTVHNLGLTANVQGDLATAQRQFAKGLAMFRELGDKPGIAMALNNLGDVALLRNDYVAARSLYGECLTLANEVGDRRRIAFSLRAFAVLTAAEGWPERAMRLDAAAVALLELIGAAQGATWRARLERRLEPARRVLSESALATARGEGETMSVERAIEYALATASLRDEPPVEPTGATHPSARRRAAHARSSTRLTGRQERVAALIAQGRTNRQIATELVIAEGSAANYVQRILNKLGFHSRAQVAAWAVEHGLRTEQI